MAQSQAKLEYSISIPDPHTHYAEIKITLSNIKSDKLHFIMPVWTPGSYLIREFEKSVEDIKAFSGDKKIEITKTAKNSWVCESRKLKSLVFSYSIYAFEFSARTSFIDADHAFLHNTSVFMFVEEYKNIAGILQVNKPTQWATISTSLEPGVKAGEYHFDNYDLLADSPIEIGNHQVLHFSVRGVPHEIAMVGQNNCDTTAFIKDLQRVCESMTGIIGEHPCKRYVFFVQNQESGGGGLEHLNSCCVVIPRQNWTNLKKYQSFLGLCAHEYFHLWNVKRLRPIELGPFDYNRENHTNLLWVAEGITSYYDEMEMFKMGFNSKNEYIKALEDYVNTLENHPGVHVQTLAQSSFDAWIKEYRQNENSRNTSISYYQKGLVVAFLLDIKIIQHTKGKKNLDDLMRLLYQKYYKKLGRGFTEKEFMDAASEIATTDLSNFFKENVYSVNTPEYEKIISVLGIKVELTAPEKNELGTTTALENRKTLVKLTLRGSSAYAGGINVNDELISINGTRVNNNVDNVLKKLEYPPTLSIILNRGGLIKNLEIPFKPLKQVHYTFLLPDVLILEQQTLFDKWIRI